MSAAHPARPLDAIAQQWCDLAERRRDYFFELFHSGRYRHYYDEAQFLDRLRDVMAAANAWSKLAGRRSSGKQAHPMP
jgi:uncharacterized repeat protein (TIGR03809 family)